MKTKYKAVKMHAGQSCGAMGKLLSIELRYAKPFFDSQPYYVLPATPEAYDAQVKAMAKAIWANNDSYHPWSWAVMNLFDDAQRSMAVAALAAIGIKRPKRNPATGTGAQGKS